MRRARRRGGADVRAQQLRYGGQQRSLTLDTVVDSTLLALDIAPGLVTAGLSGVLIASVDDNEPRSAQFAVIGVMGVVAAVAGSCQHTLRPTSESRDGRCSIVRGEHHRGVWLAH